MSEKEEITIKQELDFTAQIESFKATMAFGMAALKSLYWLSGGAAAALLAFMGYLTSHGFSETTSLLSVPLLLLFVGALCASISLGFSYIAQAEYTHTHEENGKIFQLLAVVASILGYACSFAAIAVAFRLFAKLGA